MEHMEGTLAEVIYFAYESGSPALDELLSFLGRDIFLEVKRDSIYTDNRDGSSLFFRVSITLYSDQWAEFLVEVTPGFGCLHVELTRLPGSCVVPGNVWTSTQESILKALSKRVCVETEVQVAVRVMEVK